jgi:branched-chain amino acid transport system substrate-binding protein
MQRALLALLCGVAFLVILQGCGGEEDARGVAVEKHTAPKSTGSKEAWASGRPIKIGSMVDLSGPLASVGRPYAQGIRDCVDWINSQGGAAGRPFELYEADTAYNVRRGLAAYRKLVYEVGIVANQGFGTAVTEGLIRFAAKDELPYFSASYSAYLSDPEKAPYNFFIAADYSTQLRAALKFFEERWPKRGRPRVAFVYPDHPYGLAPIPAGKKYARNLGFEIVGQENVALKAIDAVPQLKALQAKKPDMIWIGGTTPSTALILTDAHRLGIPASFFINIWGVDETIFRLAGEACEGAYSLQAAAVYGQDVPGMRIIERITHGEYKLTHYIRGFVSMLVLAEGVRLAGEKGEISGPAIKAALESLRGYDPLGLAPPISYFPDDHRPSMSVFLYRLEGGALKFLGEETLPRRPDWLGF